MNLVNELDSRQLKRLLSIIRILHENKHASWILAATFNRSLTAIQISRSCDIPITSCYKTIRMLKENNLIEVSKDEVLIEGSVKTVYKYKACFDPKFLCFEKGRIKVICPAKMELSNGNEVDLRSFLTMYSKTR
jgi:hypothetical protein